MHLDETTLPGYLRRTGLAPPEGTIQVEPVGDGNINWVRRVRLPDGSSFVVKHARQSLERFPEYSAPVERLVYEHRYGQIVRERTPAVAETLPELLHFDERLPLLAMEDLGDAPRLEAVLRAGGAPIRALRRLGHFLGAVHAATCDAGTALAGHFENRAMQELHGEHIFTLPYAPNDFPIPEQVRRRADEALARPGVRARIAALRTAYYGARRALVHADVQAGNVLIQGDRPRLLDAEIAHPGDPAFDLGTALAHLRFHTALAPDPAPFERLEAALVEGYLEGGGQRGDAERAGGFAAVEMLRRTIGAARVPLVAEAEAAERIIDFAVAGLGA